VRDLLCGDEPARRLAGASRSRIAIRAPRSCSSVTVAAPMPLAPPVTRAAIPLNSLMIQLLFLGSGGNVPVSSGDGEARKYQRRQARLCVSESVSDYEGNAMQTPALISLDLRVSASTYPGGPEHVHQVRADVRRLLDGCPVADDVVLCVSELAANAALHSDSRRPGGSFTVRTEHCPGDSVRIEVEDDGGPWVGPAPDPTHGRGLDIIRALAAEWGVTTGSAGRTVWARIDWPGDYRRQPGSACAVADDAETSPLQADLLARLAA
jgi:anti-sigma regulatory factor (Ser/Thr protein kinase)